MTTPIMLKAPGQRFQAAGHVVDDSNNLTLLKEKNSVWEQKPKFKKVA